MNRMSWKSAVLGGSIVAMGGCITVEDALRVANLANGGTTTSTSTYSPQPTPAAEPTPPPETAPASASQWSSPEALYGMFVMAYSNMGFAYGGVELKPGEYIRLGAENQGSEGPGWYERARLRDEPSGQQWWRVKFAGEKNESITMEALYAPAQQKLVRLRARLPGETAPRDYPVDHLNQVPPRHTMSPQSAGATEVGTESISVPGGTFSTHHFTIRNGEDGVDWWISDTVPGGLVKMSGRGRHGGALQLQAFGTNATTELGSY